MRNSRVLQIIAALCVPSCFRCHSGVPDYRDRTSYTSLYRDG